VEKGVELLKYSRENYPHIVRLLTTAYSDLHDAIEAVNRGEILRYIPKPWDIESLGLELRQALRFYQLHQDREQLRKEKLSVAQRVTGFNRVKDLIMMSAGMGHVRYPLHAIRACLLQFPYTCAATPAERRTDLTDMLHSELTALLDLAGCIRQDTLQPDGLAFRKVDLREQLAGACEKLAPGVSCNIEPQDTVIEAHPALTGKLLSLLIGHVVAGIKPGRGAISVRRTQDDKYLQVNMPSAIQPAGMSIAELPAPILSIYFICYHHGGSIQVDNSDDGPVFMVSLPRFQKDVLLTELPQDWQEEIFRYFETGA
jgi:two-component system probable response regulator PhcQ